jgi:hypothetical protein
MRSKIFQSVIDDMNSKPWWYKFKVKLKLRCVVLKTLGLTNYFKKRKNG